MATSMQKPKTSVMQLGVDVAEIPQPHPLSLFTRSHQSSFTQSNLCISSNRSLSFPRISILSPHDLLYCFITVRLTMTIIMGMMTFMINFIKYAFVSTAIVVGCLCELHSASDDEHPSNSCSVPSQSLDDMVQGPRHSGSFWFPAFAWRSGYCGLWL